MQPLRPDRRFHLMRLTPLRLLALVLALPLLALAGCASRAPTCSSDTDYLQATERPPLQLPPEITPTERLQPLQIPPIDPEPDKLDPMPPCLDQPPPYFARKSATVEGSALDAVRAWAAAWSARQADAVMRVYSPNFQAPGVGGADTYLRLVRQQVETGQSPEAQLEDVTSTTVSADRRLVTFTQRFGDEAVRKELTMVREGDAWRIVAERTL
jgi:hypothetical protein